MVSVALERYAAQRLQDARNSASIVLVGLLDDGP